LTRIKITIPDYQGRNLTIFCEHETHSPPTLHLQDKLLKVSTHYVNDHRIEALPGRNIVNPPPWQPQSVSAYANTCNVAMFFKDVLDHAPASGTTARYISSIQCFEDNSNQNEDNNAWWSSYHQQAFFGQRQVNNQLLCFAISQDIVAHEFTHALTSWTARLEYIGESGALDESYADIFGILISNFDNPDVQTWNWTIGNGFSSQGYAFRNLQQPGNCSSRFTIDGQIQHINHPAHMDDFLYLPYHQDHGGVHHNCNIHNHAAYRLLISQNQETNEYLFNAKTVAVLFYQALKQLSPKSGFTDSRLAIENIAKTLFRRNPPNDKQKKLEAIAAAFDSVGISPNT
jgi:bacillolysin